MLKSVDGFRFQSTLIIRDTSSEDFGYYGCAVTNALGSVEASILLEKQGRKHQEHSFLYSLSKCYLDSKYF